MIADYETANNGSKPKTLCISLADQEEMLKEAPRYLGAGKWTELFKTGIRDTCSAFHGVTLEYGAQETKIKS